MRLYAGVRHCLQAPLLKPSVWTRDGQTCADINSVEMPQPTVVDYVAVFAWLAATLGSVPARHPGLVEEGLDVSIFNFLALCSLSSISGGGTFLGCHQFQDEL